MNRLKDFYDLREQLSNDGHIKVGDFEADFGDVMELVEQQLFDPFRKLANCTEMEKLEAFLEMERLLRRSIDTIAMDGWRHSDIEDDYAA